MIGLNISKFNSTSAASTDWWNLLYPGAVLAADFSGNRAMLDGEAAIFSDFLTISRSSNGFCENEDGSLIPFLPDEFRISNKGILIESASTNLLQYSEDITAIPWAVTGSATHSANSEYAPDGSLSADLLYNMNSAGNGIEYTDGLSTDISGKTVTLSVYLKSDVSEQIDITLEATGGSATSSNTLFLLSSSWQRYTLTHSFAADDTDFIIGIKRPAGSQISQLHIWGAQLEEKPYATSYIPTTDTPATRAADNIHFHNLNWLNTSAGTILMNIQSDHGTLSNRRLLGFASAQGLDTSPSETEVEEWNGTTLLTASSPSSNWEAGAKVGLSWDQNGRSLCMGGGAIASDNELVNGLSSWYLGSRDGTQSIWEGYQKSLVYWYSRKIDADLIALTA